MYSDIVIFHIDRWSDGISMRPDGPYILTHQSAGTNDPPREPLHGPVKSGSMIMSKFWIETNRLLTITATY